MGHERRPGGGETRTTCTPIRLAARCSLAGAPSWQEESSCFKNNLLALALGKKDLAHPAPACQVAALMKDYAFAHKLPNIIKQGFRQLGLVYFFTAGEPEVRHRTLVMRTGRAALGGNRGFK